MRGSDSRGSCGGRLVQLDPSRQRSVADRRAPYPRRPVYESAANPVAENVPKAAFGVNAFVQRDRDGGTSKDRRSLRDRRAAAHPLRSDSPGWLHRADTASVRLRRRSIYDVDAAIPGVVDSLNRASTGSCDPAVGAPGSSHSPPPANTTDKPLRRGMTIRPAATVLSSA